MESNICIYYRLKGSLYIDVQKFKQALTIFLFKILPHVFTYFKQLTYLFIIIIIYYLLSLNLPRTQIDLHAPNSIRRTSSRQKHFQLQWVSFKTVNR